MSKIKIRVRMAGSVERPESVKASDLAQFLLETEKAIRETATAQGVELPDLPFLSLVGIERGRSSRLTFVVDSIVNGAPSAISKAIASGRYDKLPRAAHAALSEISKQAITHGWEIEIEPSPRLQVERAVISSDNPVEELPPLPIANGNTVIYGVCYRVGGEKNATAALRLLEGGNMTVDVTREMAKSLANRLYEEVGLEGEATWDAESWVMLSFRAASILAYQSSEIVQAFKELAEIDADRWRGVDADEHVHNLRSPGNKQ